jgi:hypothetical protein
VRWCSQGHLRHRRFTCAHPQQLVRSSLGLARMICAAAQRARCAFAMLAKLPSHCLRALNAIHWPLFASAPCDRYSLHHMSHALRGSDLCVCDLFRRCSVHSFQPLAQSFTKPLAQAARSSRSLKPLAQATHSSRVKLPFAQADVLLSRPLRPPFTQTAYSSRRAFKPPARSSCSLKSLKPPLAHDSRRSCKSCRRSLKPPLAEAVRSNVSCDERPTHGDACEPSQRTAAGHKMGL